MEKIHQNMKIEQDNKLKVKKERNGDQKTDLTLIAIQGINFQKTNQYHLIQIHQSLRNQNVRWI